MLNPILYALLLIVSFALGLWLFALYGLRPLLKWYVESKAEKTQIAHADPLLAGLNPQRPALVYFTSAACVPCKTMQDPAIKRLLTEMNDLQVITIEIPEAMDVAERWGVMAVPRTFIIGRNQHIYGTNLDYAPVEKLKQQIAAAMEADGSAPIQIFRA